MFKSKNNFELVCKNEQLWTHPQKSEPGASEQIYFKDRNNQFIGIGPWIYLYHCNKSSRTLNRSRYYSWAHMEKYTLLFLSVWLVSLGILRTFMSCWSNLTSNTDKKASHIQRLFATSENRRNQSEDKNDRVANIPSPKCLGTYWKTPRQTNATNTSRSWRRPFLKAPSLHRESRDVICSQVERTHRPDNNALLGWLVVGREQVVAQVTRSGRPSRAGQTIKSCAAENIITELHATASFCLSKNCAQRSRRHDTTFWELLENATVVLLSKLLKFTVAGQTSVSHFQQPPPALRPDRSVWPRLTSPETRTWLGRGSYLWGDVEDPERWKCTFCHLPSRRYHTRVSSDCIVFGIPTLANITTVMIEASVAGCRWFDLKLVHVHARTHRDAKVNRTEQLPSLRFDYHSVERFILWLRRCDRQTLPDVVKSRIIGWLGHHLSAVASTYLSMYCVRRT